jgi:uncharacterized membrane protein
VLGVGETTARLRTAHRRESGVLQHALDRVTAALGWPGFVVLLSLALVCWVVVNVAAPALGLHAPDPSPFNLLQAITSAGALVVACLILTTQRREEKLADYRNQLILELSISNDQKIAKIIGLIEESRRDNPAITNRVDVQAATMSSPSNAAEVLEAIRELNEDNP